LPVPGPLLTSLAVGAPSTCSCLASSAVRLTLLSPWSGLIRSEATDRESNLWISLCEWQGGLSPMRWAVREISFPRLARLAGEGWDGGKGESWLG